MSTRRAIAAGLALAAACVATPATAQDAPAPATDLPWGASYFPFVSKFVNDGPVLGLLYEYRQAADYFDRVPYLKAVQAEGYVGWHGSWNAALRYSAPRLADGWRLRAAVRAGFDRRLEYWGLGNATAERDFNVYIQPPATPILTTDPEAYRVRRRRYDGAVEVTRRLKGPLHLAAAAGAEHVTFSAPDAVNSAWEADYGRDLAQTDVTARVTLVLDTRDKTHVPSRGVLLEAGGLAGSGGDGYTRVHAVAAGWIPLREGTTLALRAGGDATGGTPPLNARYDLQRWEGRLPTLGGEHSHRGLSMGRYVGKGSVFANAEVRHDILPLGELGGIGAVAFADVGRVYEDESFTLDGLKWGGGGGLSIRILRAYVLTLNFAGGPDGFRYTMTSGWMF